MNKPNKVRPQWPLSEICGEGTLLNVEHISFIRKQETDGKPSIGIYLTGLDEPLILVCKDVKEQNQLYITITDDLASYYRYKHRLIDQYRLHFEDLKKHLKTCN